MNVPDLNEQLRNEWRAQGFFYDRDDPSKEWRLTGSRAGLLRFRDALVEYASKPGSTQLSEHEHFWPYGYLKIMTWSSAGMDCETIHGSVDDLRYLAHLIGASLDKASPGATVRIRDEYVAGCEYSLVLSVQEDAFDPSTVDPGLKAGEAV